MRTLLLIASLLVFELTAHTQTLWSDVSADKVLARGGERRIAPQNARLVRLDVAAFRGRQASIQRGALTELDQRAAGLEPVESLSGYRWQGGLGYYQSIRDAAMHFFFDRVVPGTHVFEYELKVTHAGSMSNGLTTAMCMYAPEFSTHSEGVRLMVK